MPVAPRLPAPTALAALLSAALAATAAEPEPAPPVRIELSPVVVTGSRVEHASFDLPAAVDVVERSRIVDGQARVNASEALAAVPGLAVQNRQNYAQDLQISSRGFGARSAFGVRGVKLIADGIPATMPDGQGQAATFNLDQAERMEVLRGPFSAIYGNHAGGVVQLFTREGKGAPTVEGTLMGGTYGTWKSDLGLLGKSGPLGYVLDASRFHTDGYREHSAATRDQALAKLGFDAGPDTKLTLVANGLRQRDTQDPLGLTWSAFQANPRGVDPAALAFNTRKSIDHVQAGVNLEQRFGADRLQLTVYGGQRQVIQFQSIPKGAQTNPKHSGGVVDFDRDFAGLGLRWSAVRALAGGETTFTAGVDYDRSRDERRGYENFIGDVLGVRGALRRQETDTVTSVDPYLQIEWQDQVWGVTAGLRHSRVRFDVADHYLANGDDSGKVGYSQTTPVAAVLYKLSPTVNLYASAAKGFESPTFNELFYSGSGGGFNFALKPARSRHFEVGAKAYAGADTRVDLALFDIRTTDELVVDTATGGRTSFRNAGRTRRQGIELAVDARLAATLDARLAFTRLRAEYDEAFTSGSTLVPAGKRIPGVPATTLFAELAWRPAPGAFAAVEGIYRSKVYVEDTNQQAAAPSYTVVNLRAGVEQRAGGWRFKEFVRLDNAFDRNYIGSVIVGDTNGRFYEPAPRRAWLVGASAAYTF